MYKKILVITTGALLVILPLLFSLSVQAAGDDKIKEYEPNVTYDEYLQRYEKVYGDFTKQMDEEGNPADFLTEDGADLFRAVEGTMGKSCSSCHGKDGKDLKGAAATYPKFDKALNGIMTIPLKINFCRQYHMGAKPLKYESYDQLALTLYVKSLSNGMKINVDISGPAKKHYTAGKKFYYKRMGQWNFNCAVCHVSYSGQLIRANLLSPNLHHADHWPSYRLKWSKTGSLHRRFRGCMKNMRAKPQAYQSETYRDLELYLTSIANGLPIEVPGMRM